MVLFLLGHCLLVIWIFSYCLVVFENGLENVFDYPLLQLSIGQMSKAFQEWGHYISYVLKRCAISIDLIEFLDENVWYLQWYSGGSLRGVLAEKVEYQIRVPSYQISLVLILLNKLEEGAKHKSKKHKVLVYPEVVHFVPVWVENVQETLKPLLFVFLLAKFR